MLNSHGQRVRHLAHFNAETSTPTLSGYVESRDPPAIARELPLTFKFIGT